MIPPDLIILFKENLPQIRAVVIANDQALRVQHQSILSKFRTQHTLLQQIHAEQLEHTRSSEQHHNIIVSQPQEQDSFLDEAVASSRVYTTHSNERSNPDKMLEQQNETILSRLARQDSNLKEAVESIKAHMTSTTQPFQTGNTMGYPRTLDLTAGHSTASLAVDRLNNALETREGQEGLLDL